jgi:hypothetical protein
VEVPVVPPDIDMPPPDPEQLARMITPKRPKNDARGPRQRWALTACVFILPNLLLVHLLLSEKISSHRMVSVTFAPAPRFVHAAGLAVAVAVSVFGPVRAQARTVVVAAQLDYAAASGCPTVDDFEAVVNARLGYRAFRPDAPGRVVVRIESAGRALEGRLEWRDATGTAIGEQLFPSRTGDCAELTRAMGFALALQIQLMAATVGENSPPPPPAPPEDTAVPKVTAPPPPSAPAPVAQIQSTGSGASEATENGDGPAVLAGVGAAAGLGLSSDPIAVARLFVTMAWSHVAVELGGEASVPSTTHRGDGAGFSQEQILASVAGCGLRGPFSVCAVGKAGELRVVGQGVDVPLTASGVMILAGLRLAASHTFGHRTYIVGRLEGLARLTRGTVTLDSMPVWTSPTFAALLGIDVGFRFK